MPRVGITAGPSPILDPHWRPQEAHLLTGGQGGLEGVEDHFPSRFWLSFPCGNADPLATAPQRHVKDDQGGGREKERRNKRALDRVRTSVFPGDEGADVMDILHRGEPARGPSRSTPIGRSKGKSIIKISARRGRGYESYVRLPAQSQMLPVQARHEDLPVEQDPGFAIP